MPDTDIGQGSDEVDVESRRKFLKVSMVTGAAVAAVAAGVHFMPSLESAAKSQMMPSNSPGGQAVASSVPTTSGDEIVLVVEGDRVSVYKGEDKYVSNDSSFARQIASSVRERL